MSDIPNCHLAQLTSRGLVRLFFPLLYRVGSPATMDAAHLKQIYEKCLLPVICELIPQIQSRWPSSWDAAQVQYRDHAGRLHFTSIDIPSDILPEFGPRFLQSLEAKFTWAKGVFYGTEIRGAKGATAHDLHDPLARQIAENDFTEIIDLDLVRDDEEWDIDIGIEGYEDEVNMQWRKDAHGRLLRYLLPSATIPQIEALLRSQKRYTSHINGGLTQVAGFTASPGIAGVADHVSYINVYTTDKNSAYQLHKGLYRRRKPEDTYPQVCTKLAKDVQSMSDTMVELSRKNWAGNTRVEIRVPLKYARDALTSMPDHIITHCMVAFPAHVL